MPQSIFTRAASRLHRMNIPTSLNSARLLNLKDKHKGDKCVIIAMGPSLKTEDLDALGDTITFACNKIYLSFPDTTWRPTYYTVCDILVAENNVDEIHQVNAIRLFPKSVEGKIRQKAGDIYYDYRGSVDTLKTSTGFQNNLADGILGAGYSVIIDQIQLAYYMGFTEVAIIGLDFNFTVSKSSGTSCKHGEVLISEGETNHYHPNYRKPGETWTVPRLDKQEHAFQFMKFAYEQAGRKLVNASRFSKLDVLDRVPIESIIDCS